MYTVQQIINIACVSEYLAANDIAKGGTFGGGIDIQLPRKLYCVRKAVQARYNESNSDSTLTATSNYLYALCAPYNGQAAVISGSTSGGNVSPINPNASPTPYDFAVTDSSFIANGISSINISAFKGYNILFIRNNIPQSQTDTGGTFFTWNKATGDFSVTGAAATDELFQIYPFI